jgi:hypothetical protein
MGKLFSERDVAHATSLQYKGPVRPFIKMGSLFLILLISKKIEEKKMIQSKYILRVCLIIMVAYISACTQVNVRTKSAMGNFYEKVNKKEFFNKATYKMTMMESSPIASISLFRVPQIVQASIKMSEVDQILFVKLTENRFLNIDRHLIFGKEYLFDSDKGKLFVLIDLPIIYLLKERLDIYLDILTLNSSRNSTKNIRKKIVFNWKPLKRNEATGFNYGHFGADDKLIETETITKIVAEEYKQAAIKRFNKDYVDLLNSVFPQK